VIRPDYSFPADATPVPGLDVPPNRGRPGARANPAPATHYITWRLGEPVPPTLRQLIEHAASMDIDFRGYDYSIVARAEVNLLRDSGQLGNDLLEGGD
jgi:hypothetical protein